MSTSKSPGGKHVTITVKETKTERTTPVNQHYGKMISSMDIDLIHDIYIGFSGGNQDIERQIFKTSTPVPRVSSATQDLDDLMASLSDFKVSLLYI